MNLFARLFGSGASRPAAAAQQSQPHGPASQGANPATPAATRRELLRVVLRDMLSKNGIPPAWIGAEILTAMGADKESGLHMRMVIRHWDPRLLECTIAFQKGFLQRAEMFDPTLRQWLLGISWQFQLDSDADCPELPPPITWSTPPSPRAEPAKPDPADYYKAALDKLLDNRNSGFDRPGFEPTQPMFPPTESARF